VQSRDSLLYPRVRIPEVVIDGVTGYACDDPADLAQAVRDAERIDPAACRQDAETRSDVVAPL